MPRDFVAPSGLLAGGQYDHHILLLDDSEGAYRWTVTGNAGNYSGKKGSTYAYFGLEGHTVSTRATTPAAEDWVRVSRVLTYPRFPRLICRLRLCLPDVSDNSTVEFQLDVYNGTRHYRAALIIVPNTPAVNYLSSAGVNVAITGFAYAWNDGDWVMVEFGIDLSQWEYTKAYFNGVEASLEGIAVRDVEASTRRGVEFSMRTVAIGAAQAVIGVDALYIGASEEL